MSIRAMLQELSQSTGIPFETLRGRWKRGWRGDELTAGKGAQVLRKRPLQSQPPTVNRCYGRALPVRVPISLRYR